MQRALRGVNLGGWLVLEKWMTPTLFDGTAASDEYTYCLSADESMRNKLRNHRDRFIAQKDFQWLRANGVQAVRIPIGHWVFGDISPYIKTVKYLDDAFEWAEAAGLKVLISLHGAPGSQNGEMHSGQQASIGWHTDPQHIELTLGVISRLAERYKESPALWGISLLNEPSRKIPKRLLKHFYRTAYWNIREICGDKLKVVFSDGFQPRRWNYVLHQTLYRNAVIDTHQYQIFKAVDKAMSAEDHLRRTVSDIPLLLNRMRRHHPVVVGEWSAALDGQSLVGLDNRQRQQAYKAYCNAQLQAYSRMDAWFYWSYKTEEGGVWSYRDCHEKGWL